MGMQLLLKWANRWQFSGAYLGKYRDIGGGPAVEPQLVFTGVSGTDSHCPSSTALRHSPVPANPPSIVDARASASRSLKATCNRRFTSGHQDVDRKEAEKQE